MAEDVPEIVVTGTKTTPDYRVKLTRAASKGTNQVERVIWDATPEFSESRTIMYKNIDPVHAPGAIYQYSSTGSRTFSIGGKFISRSINEATRTLAYVQYLRAWAMPVFGIRDEGDNPSPGEDILGAPPAILLLTAYANQKTSVVDVDAEVSVGTGYDASKQKAYGNNIWEVPVVITSLEIPYPQDIDYIPTVNNIPVPTIMNISVQLVETHSPRKYSQFDLQRFKRGTLLNF